MKSILVNRMMPLLFYIYIFALSGSRWNAVYSISCALLWGTVLWQFLKVKHRNIGLPEKKFNLVYWPFFLCIMVSSVILGDTLSIQQAWKYFYWSLPFCLLFILYQYFQYQKLILSAIALALIVIGGHGILQYLQAPQGMYISGLFGNPNHFATMVSLNLTFLLGCLYASKMTVRLRIFLYVACLIGYIALILSGSRGSIIGLIAGGGITIALYTWRNKAGIRSFLRVLAISIAIACAFAGGFLISGKGWQQPYDNERIKLLVSTYHMWSDHPYLGVGLNNWDTEYQQKYILPDAKERTLNIPHNVPAYFFSTTGSLAGCSYLLYSIGVYWYLFKQLKRCQHNVFIVGCMWASLTLTIHGLVDVGIMMENALKLYSGFLGITLASIVMQYKKGVHIK